MEAETKTLAWEPGAVELFKTDSTTFPTGHIGSQWSSWVRCLQGKEPWGP